jgi:hypothetical protein
MVFRDWLELKKREKTNPAENFIQQMEAHKIDWPLRIKNKDVLMRAINESDVPEAVKKVLLEDLKALWVEYEQIKMASQKNQQGLMGCLDKVIAALVLSPMATVIGGISILLIGIIFFALAGKNEFLQNLANVEFARGLITFLFAIGTIGIALIITFSVFASERSLAESKERFYRGKEILTILIGILGTIVGFYFGSPTDSAKEISPIELSEIQMSDLKPVMEKPLSLCSLVTGGSPPYKYTVTIMEGENLLMEFKEQPSKNGMIFLSFSPRQRERGYKIKPVLTAVDAEGRSNTIMGKEVEIQKPRPIN